MKKEKFNDELFEFINNATCSFTCIDLIKNDLIARGYTEVYESEKWDLKTGKYFVTRNDASIIAFNIGRNFNEGFNIICAHSDTPGFNLKPKSEVYEYNYLKLNVMPYGGILNYGWMDRPLSIAGRVVLKDGNKYKKKSNEELEKEVEQLRDRISKAQKPIEIKKMYKEIKKIENELGSRENKIKKEEKKTGVHKGTVYEGNKIKSDLSKILKEVERMLKNEAGIKEFNDNGLEICKGDDVYQLCGDDHSEFHGGTDEFCIVRIDLWDYKGGNPREIMNDSDDGWHPVNHAEEKLRLKLEKFLKEKYPHFYVCDYGGDWDTGGIEIGLRR